MKDGRPEGKHSSEGARRPAGQRLGAVRPRCPARAPPEAAGRGDSPPLTGPEQHRPVEPGGLRGPPHPLSQPLRHAPARWIAELGPQAASAPRSAVLCRSTFTAVTRRRSKPRRRSGYAGQECQALRRPRGRDRRRGARPVSLPRLGTGKPLA